MGKNNDVFGLDPEDIVRGRKTILEELQEYLDEIKHKIDLIKTREADLMTDITMELWGGLDVGSALAAGMKYSASNFDTSELENEYNNAFGKMVERLVGSFEDNRMKLDIFDLKGWDESVGEIKNYINKAIDFAERGIAEIGNNKGFYGPVGTVISEKLQEGLSRYKRYADDIATLREKVNDDIHSFYISGRTRGELEASMGEYQEKLNSAGTAQDKLTKSTDSAENSLSRITAQITIAISLLRQFPEAPDIKLPEMEEEVFDTSEDKKAFFENIDMSAGDMSFGLEGIETYEEMIERVRKKAQKAFAEDMVQFVGAFNKEFTNVFGAEATNTINGFVGLFNQAEGSLGTMWSDHWAGVLGLSLNALSQIGGSASEELQIVGGALMQFQGVLEENGNSLATAWEQDWDQFVGIGLSALQQLTGGTNTAINAISGAFSGAMQGFQIAGPWGAVAGGALGFVSSIAGAFKDPTVEEEVAMAGSKWGKVFGTAYTDEMHSAVLAAAKIVADNSDMEYRGAGLVEQAMLHPSVVAQTLEQLDDFGYDVQEKFAHIFEDNVSAMLQRVMKLSPQEAAQEMSGLFEIVIQKSLAAGESLSPTMQRMLDWAIEMGVEFDGMGDILQSAYDELYSSGDATQEQLQGVVDLAEQFGVELKTASDIVREELIGSIEELLTKQELSRKELRQLNKMLEEAGDISSEINVDTLIDGLERSKEAIKALRDENKELGTNLMEMEMDRFDMEQRHAEWRKDHVQGEVDERMEAWQEENESRLENMSDEERAAEEKKAREKIRKEEQEDFNKLLDAANSIEIDGKHDRRDLLNATKGMSEEERAIVQELVRQRLEKIEHRKQMKAIRKERRKNKKMIEKEKELQEKINTKLDQTKTFVEGMATVQEAWSTSIDGTISKYGELETKLGDIASKFEGGLIPSDFFLGNLPNGEGDPQVGENAATSHAKGVSTSHTMQQNSTSSSAASHVYDPIGGRRVVYEVPLIVDGREIARAMLPYQEEAVSANRSRMSRRVMKRRGPGNN